MVLFGSKFWVSRTVRTLTIAVSSGPYCHENKKASFLDPWLTIHSESCVSFFLAIFGSGNAEPRTDHLEPK